MSDKRLSIDELLNDQANPSLRATVEKIEGKEDLVKVTPWTASGGCLCHLAIDLPKDSLEGATPTGDLHICCGKSLRVVELHFKKEHTITLEDLFQQIQAKAAGHNHHLPSSSDDSNFQPRAPRLQVANMRLRLYLAPRFPIYQDVPYAGYGHTLADCEAALKENLAHCAPDDSECNFVANESFKACRRLL